MIRWSVALLAVLVILVGSTDAVAQASLLDRPQRPVSTRTLRPSPTPTARPTATRTPTRLPTRTPTPLVTPAPAGYAFGTLLSDPANAIREAEAGLHVAELELGWDAYEPAPGVFDAQYAAAARARLATFQQAGLHVVLGAGLQYPPAWVFDLPASQFVDQDGVRAGEPNLVFSLAVRQAADAYLARLLADLGPRNIWAVRVGAGGDVELLYPGEDDGAGEQNAYWAYDDAAQTGAGETCCPGVTPLPGWAPGDTVWNGQAVTPAMVAAWDAWYVGALADVVNWQVAAYREKGFTGAIQVLMPGVGSRPDEAAAAIAARLDGTGDPNGTMGRGALWDQLVAALPADPGVVVYVSSMADGSGGNDRCQPGDGAVDLTADSQVDDWSATRWIVANAARRGFRTMGENPGPNDTSSYGRGMLATAAAQMAACHMLGVLWAHDVDIYRVGSGINLSDVATIISQYP